jgi:hypothetical protein
MKQRLPLVIALLALTVAVLGTTPVGSEAAQVIAFARNAGAVNGIKASAKPRAGYLVPLGKDGKFPAAVVPASGNVLQGAQGIPGPQGPQGVQGPQGAQGPQGPAGTFRAYGYVDPTSPSLVAARTHNIASVSRVSTGVYCLTVSGGINVAATSPFAQPEFGGSVGSTLDAYVYLNPTGTCTMNNQLEVVTFSSGSAVNNVAFVVGIP